MGIVFSVIIYNNCVYCVHEGVVVSIHHMVHPWIIQMCINLRFGCVGLCQQKLLHGLLILSIQHWLYPDATQCMHVRTYACICFFLSSYVGKPIVII